jgi:CO/xanthine dehydrogenase Mo-binding subunit
MAQRLPDLIPSMLPYWVPRGARDAFSSIFRAVAPRFIAGKKAIEGASPLLYHVENVRVDFIRDDPGIPTGFWRSVSHSSNAFVVECFMDEIAASSGRDPIELREALLKEKAPLLSVLNAVKEKSNWGRPMSKGISQGVAVHDFHDTALAMVAEVSVDENDSITVDRMVCAVDCGIVVNPGIVEAQVQGGIAFGLTAALKSSVTIKNGRVEQSNFDDFPLIRMDEMPKCDVYIMPSTRPPSGIGEAAVPLVAPAVANAVFSETGKRVRTLPISV